MNELFCPSHGPYDASYGSCPYCGQGAGAPMQNQLPDDAPTDIGGYGGGVYAPPPPAGLRGDEAPTDLGYNNMGAGAVDGEVTEIGRNNRADVTEVEFADTGALGILWVKQGSRRGLIYKIQDGTVVGRKDGGLILDDPKVSNPHAKFTFEDETFVLWDFGSKNGTFVNGQKIRGATELNENDEIKIGDSVFVLKILL